MPPHKRSSNGTTQPLICPAEAVADAQVRRHNAAQLDHPCCEALNLHLQLLVPLGELEELALEDRTRGAPESPSPWASGLDFPRRDGRRGRAGQVLEALLHLPNVDRGVGVHGRHLRQHHRHVRLRFCALSPLRICGASSLSSVWCIESST